MDRRVRRWGAVLATVALAGGLALGGRQLWGAWRRRAALVSVHSAIESGRYATAAGELRALLAWQPDCDEAAYLLGSCEKARGRARAAEAAWVRVSDSSRFRTPALLGRAGLLVDQGRCADAERLLPRETAGPGADPVAMAAFLAPLYWNQGRTEDARHVIEAAWEGLERAAQAGSDRAVDLVRKHIALSLGTSSAARVEDFLAGAARLAPDDDRVWLGKANLAVRQGEFDEAARWLADCVKRRPEDVAVWRAWLNWSLASGRPADLETALDHLAVADVARDDPPRLAAWLAARRGDRATERRALERLVALNPGDGAALDRLAELETRDGRPDRAADWGRRKARRDQIHKEYRELFLRDQPGRDAVAMARLAEELGRYFESRACWELARASGAPDDEYRAARTRREQRERDAAPKGPARVLARAIAAEFGTAGASGPKTDGPERERGPSIVPRFRDDAVSAGLAAHVFNNGETERHQLPEVSGGGAGLLDWDGDGRLDVYAVQGGPFPPPPGRAPRGDRLFRNRGDGTFEDATAAAGLARLPGGYGHGVAIGDYDNDGRADVFVARWRAYALYRNTGGAFEDVTAAAGLAGDRDWPTSAAFADLDNDGDLDLYVCHYLKWDAERPPLCRGRGRDTVISCDPRSFEAMPDHVFRNDGGHFVDVTDRAGVVDRDGRGFGVVAVDVDDDGRVDLFVANDQSANYLFHNIGGFRFEETGLIAGTARNAQGGNQAGMGAAAGDLDGDGRPDLAVTNFFDESTTLFHNLGDCRFADHTAAAGLAVPSRRLLGFGIAFLDANNDGRLDLLTANGHVNDFRPEVPYAMPAQLLIGGPDGRLKDVSARAGPPFEAPHIGRGLAVGDIDNDGRIDAIIVAHNEPLVYLHNRTEGGHFLSIALEGSASNRDGVGARATVTAGGRRQTARRLGGGSFLSAHDGRLHFGLGTAERVDRLEVRWPSGRTDRFEGLAVDHRYLVREGARQPRALD